MKISAQVNVNSGVMHSMKDSVTQPQTTAYIHIYTIDFITDIQSEFQYFNAIQMYVINDCKNIEHWTHSK